MRDFHDFSISPPAYNDVIQMNNLSSVPETAVPLIDERMFSSIFGGTATRVQFEADQSNNNDSNYINLRNILWIFLNLFAFRFFIFNSGHGWISSG